MDDLLGREGLSIFMPPSQLHQNLSNLGLFLEKDYQKNSESVVMTKSGEAKIFAWNNTILRDVNQEIIGVIGIGVDVTEQRAIERLKDEFISIVSHELRTPLTAIRASLGLLTIGIYERQPEKAKRMLEIALTDSDRHPNPSPIKGEGLDRGDQQRIFKTDETDGL